MGLLTGAGNVLGNLGRKVPAGSTRDRLIGALAGGVEGTQNLLAGRYAQGLREALSPANTVQYAPLAYGLIGAGGSVVGNVMSGQEKDPGRILAEAAGAGALGALSGGSIANLANKRLTAQEMADELSETYKKGAVSSLRRAQSAEAVGAPATAAAARQRELEQIQELADVQNRMSGFNAATRFAQGIHMAALPAVAGLGGMIGGGLSNAVSAVGVPGFSASSPPVDPESYGSSNSPGARYKAPTLQYLP